MDLIKIIKNIKNNKIKLIIVGKGSLQNSLTEEIVRSHLSDKFF